MVKARKLVLHTQVMGFGADIATIKIGGYARARELREWTDLICTECKEKPSHHGSYYECECGASFTSWAKLLRVLKGTKQPLEKPKLTKGNGELERAKLFTMPFEEFSKYVDAQDPKEPERFVTVEDDTSKINLFKLLVAHEIDKKAIIITFNDTYEQKIALLTTTSSGRIVLRFIVPKNLVMLKESLMMDKTNLTEKDIEEARMFLKQIPKATEKDLCVNDYRIGSIKAGEEKPTEKVEQLAVIMVHARKKKAKK